jgi:nucleotide-binding universal stress UspA family protein
MFERILYSIDFSRIAKKAVPYIENLKGAGTKEVIMLYVRDQRGIDSQHVTSPMDVLFIQKEWEESALDEMSHLQDQLEEMGFNVKVLITKGIPYKEILRVSEEEKVSVIIMGSQGKSDIIEMLLGSVTEKVIKESRKSVLVVRR